MPEYKYSKRSVIVFFALVISLTIPAEVSICLGGPDIMYLFLMWIPAIAAGAANLLSLRDRGEQITLRSFFGNGGFRRAGIGYILLGCLLPLIYLLIPYMIFWKMYPESFAYTGVSLLLILQDLTLPMLLGTIVSLLSAMGEEIGWRGFMVPALLERLGLKKMLLVTSLIWCCWHLPILIFGGYMEGTPVWYQVPAFILCIMPVGIMAGLLTIRSGSMWPAAFLHAAHNNYDQAVFGIITRADNNMYFVSETGILTILCAWILAIVMYLAMRRKLTKMLSVSSVEVEKEVAHE